MMMFDHMNGLYEWQALLPITRATTAAAAAHAAGATAPPAPRLNLAIARRWSLGTWRDDRAAACTSALCDSKHFWCRTAPGRGLPSSQAQESIELRVCAIAIGFSHCSSRHDARDHAPNGGCPKRRQA